MERSANRGRVRAGRGGKVFTAAALAVAGLLHGQPAHAQVSAFNPFRGYRGPPLTRDDLSAASAAAQKLLNDEPASVGQTETWVGPKTGNEGTLTIQDMFERSGMPCRNVASRIEYKTGASREFTLRACRVAGGAWKLAG